MMLLWLINWILALAGLWYVLRYNLHMFQLNSYQYGEQRAWLTGNWKRQAVVFVPALLACVLCGIHLFGDGIPEVSVAEGLSAMTLLSAGLSGAPLVLAALLSVLMVPVLAFVLYYFRFLKRYLNKKPLVLTPRVHRMILTFFVLGVLWMLAGLYLLGLSGALAACCLWMAATQVLILLVNLINHPAEQAINAWYLGDAKKKLAAAEGMRIIGITGSYGKTSMKYYLQTLLSDSFNLLITPGNFNTPLGVTRTVRGSLRPTQELFLCEMGARYTGEIKELCDLVHPDWGVITSIGPQHLDTFGGIEQVADTKFELADGLKPEGKLFLNADNAYIRQRLDRYPDAVCYSTDPALLGDRGGYWAGDISVSSQGTRFTLHTPSGESCSFSMPLVGGHNVINVTGALAAACELGISLDALRVPVRRLAPAEHRMQMKTQGNVTLIDDAYNSNPVGSKAAVETLALFSGVRILVTPGMVELGEEEAEYNRLFGTYAASCCDHIVLVGEKRTRPILEGALSCGFPKNRIAVFPKVQDAIAYAYGLKDPGHKYILLENDLPDVY